MVATEAAMVSALTGSSPAVIGALALGLLHLSQPTLLMRIGAYAPQHAIIQSSHSGFEVDGEPEACRFLDWDVVAKQLDSLDHLVDAGEPRSGEADMTRAFIAFIVAIAVLWASNAIAQTALTEPQQPAAKIVVDPPLAEPLSRGVVFIQYRTENLQIVPVFGPKALDVTPRIGHLHVAVDGAPWVWAETSGGPIIVAGLPAGPHKVEITPVNANHQPLDRSVVVEFVVPGGKAAK